MSKDYHCSHGPVSTMPGSVHCFPVDAKCDDHPDQPAVVRIQGETDSFGCEYMLMCDMCYAEHRLEKDKGYSGRCDLCSSHVPDLKAWRDWEEGSSGPVYYVCGGCRKKRSDEDHRMFAAMRDDNFDWED